MPVQMMNLKDRFYKKLDVLNQLYEQQRNAVNIARQMLLGVQTALDNAIKASKPSETIDFLQCQVKESNRCLSVEWEQLSILRGRKDQCIEFINEENQVELEDEIIVSMKPDPNIINNLKYALKSREEKEHA